MGCFIYTQLTTGRLSADMKHLLCSRNNGYAISTPTRDQYRGDGIGIIPHYVYLLMTKCFASAPCSVAEGTVCLSCCPCIRVYILNFVDTRLCSAWRLVTACSLLQTWYLNLILTNGRQPWLENVTYIPKFIMRSSRSIVMLIVSSDSDFLLLYQCGTFITFSLHNKWTANLHNYNVICINIMTIQICLQWMHIIADHFFQLDDNWAMSVCVCLRVCVSVYENCALWGKVCAHDDPVGNVRFVGNISFPHKEFE